MSNPHSRSLSAYKYDVYDVAQWVTQEYPLSSFSGLLELKQQKLKRKQELKAQRQVRENKRKTKMDELLLKSNCLSLEFAQTTTPYKNFVMKGPMKLLQSCANSIQLLVFGTYMSSEINKQQLDAQRRQHFLQIWQSLGGILLQKFVHDFLVKYSLSQQNKVDRFC